MNAERALRQVLVADAATSAVAAVAGVALAGPIGRLLDVPSAVVVVVAASFVPWAVALARLAGASRHGLHRWTPWVAEGNAAFVIAAVAVLAAGVVDRSGWWLLVPVAVAVADVGVAQWLLWRRLDRTTSAPVGRLVTS